MHIIFIDKKHQEHKFSFENGQTLLNVLKKNDVILNAFCEGHSICGGCHVIIEWSPKELTKISDDENDGLDKAKSVTHQSRLSCQIILHSNLSGLRVRIA